MKTNIIYALGILCTLSFFSSCKPEGPGGTSEIAVFVKHHEEIIPYAMVYIKYGAKESPGTNTSVYDDSVLTDVNGHNHFHDLQKGDYYLYAIGYDSSQAATVTGGIPVKVKGGEELETDVPVTE